MDCILSPQAKKLLPPKFVPGLAKRILRSCGYKPSPKLNNCTLFDNFVWNERQFAGAVVRHRGRLVVAILYVSPAEEANSLQECMAN